MPFTAQKMKFPIKDLSSKCDRIRSFLQIWPHLLKKSLISLISLIILKILNNTSDKDYHLQGVISGAAANVDQNDVLHNKKDNNQSKIILRNERIEATGETKKTHKKHHLN